MKEIYSDNDLAFANLFIGDKKTALLHVQALMRLKQDIGEISSCLEYLAARTRCVIISSSEKSLLCDPVMDEALDSLTCAMRDLLSELLAVHFAVSVSQSVLNEHVMELQAICVADKPETLVGSGLS
jgi:hypothetical protein